jgi:hypothetical protein
MPDQIEKGVEKEILGYVEEYPIYGPERIADELRKITDGRIGHTGGGIHMRFEEKRLEQKDLKDFSILRSMEMGYSPNFFKKNSQRGRKTTLRPTTQESLSSWTPSWLVSSKASVRYAIKRVWTATPRLALPSSISPRGLRLPVTFWKKLCFPVYRALYIPLHGVLTDDGREHTALGEQGKEKHIFERTLRRHGVRHSSTKIEHPWTNGYAESFHETPLNDFYHLAFRGKIYASLEELQKDLDEFLYSYNFERTHRGWKLNPVENLRFLYGVNGKTPAEKFLNGGRCLALESPKI